MSKAPRATIQQAAPNPETQLAGYFARYEPATAKLGHAIRLKLRARLPGVAEFVYLYENQQALVISYTPTQHGKDGVVSLGLYPEGVRLYFAHAAKLLKADASKLLQGTGKTVRYVPLTTAEDLDRPEIEALMQAALELAKLVLDPRATGAVIIKAEEQKKRAEKQRAQSARKSKP